MIETNISFNGYVVYVNQYDPAKELHSERTLFRCWIHVEPSGYISSLGHWYYGGEQHKSGGYRLSDPEDKARWDAEKELYEILRDELELIEFRAIGPEDSEYFATDKLWDIIEGKTHE